MTTTRILEFRPRLATLAAWMLMLGMGCGESTAPPEPVATVTIAPPSVVLLVPGGTELLVASPTGLSGKALIGRDAIWSSSDSSTVQVVAGLMTGIATGTATVTVSVEGKTASVDVEVRDGGVVTAAGASFSVFQGAVSVGVPVGAVTQTRNLSVRPATNPPPARRFVQGTAYDFGPEGMTFLQPVTITIKYDPTKLDSDSPETGLQLYEAVQGAWRVVQGSAVDVTARTVSGNVTHFSAYGVLMQPIVDTVRVAGPAASIVVKNNFQFTAVLKDSAGETLTRPITWSSSAPAVMQIDAATGAAAALTPGTATITATSENRLGTAIVTVVPGPPAHMLRVTSETVNGAAGVALASPPAVKITDEYGNGISGFTVTFAVASGGGSVTGGTATTNGNGFASPSSWTLGTTVGSNTISATAAALPESPMTFTAIGNAGAPATIAASSATSLTGTAGGLVGTAPSAKVVDAFGNAVGGVNVVFAPASGSGSVTGGNAATNSSGIATVGSWRLGTTPGNQTLQATLSGVGGSPVMFTAVAAAPVPSSMVIVAGNGQSVVTLTAVPVPPAVRITDPAGVPVPGVTVTFAVTGGDGTITGANAVTNADGVAAVGSWVLGSSPGGNTLSASAGSLTAVAFTATAIAPTPVAISIVAGQNQTSVAGIAVPVAPAVKVTDVRGLGVPSIAVTFAITSGGGSLTSGNAVTNSSGIATVGSWTLGTAAGSNSLTATAAGLPESPIAFIAIGNPGAPATIAANSATSLSGAAGELVATLPSVKVVDTFGNPVAGVTVVFAPASGSGSVSGGSATTNSSGIATVGSWRLGTTPGNQTLQATLSGVSGSPVTFTVTAIAPTPVAISIVAGQNQTSVAGVAVPVAPAVKVTDAQGLGVPSIAVTFSITSGGGSLTSGNAVTNSSGIATVGSWTLGIGSNSLSAAKPGLAGSPITFVATGVPFIQLVTFGDSNTDYGYQGSSPTRMASSYVSNARPRPGPNAPNSPFQLAGKIEAKWRASRPEMINVVNHGIASTGTGTGRTGLSSPNALEVVNGFTRFEGEVLGRGYPWSGGESTNSAFPNGPIFRVRAFTPRASDFVYVSLGTNDIVTNVNTDSISVELSRLVDMWVGAGLAANHFIITTLPPRDGATSLYVPGMNVQIRRLASERGLRLIDLATFASNDEGSTWKSPNLHIDGDLVHYSEEVRDWLADRILEIINAP